jgi:acetylornithine deacetylase/succinyl-diaminopimelate desuccinylase-like protein
LDGVHLLGAGSVAERVVTKPAASVLAIDAPAVAEASNTLIPAARAKVSVRIAPSDDASRAGVLLADHLRRHAPWGVRVEVTPGSVGQPFAVDSRGPVFAAARDSYGQAYGREAAEIGLGGTIPFVAAFADAFPDTAILVTSAGADPACRAHGVDESLHLGDFANACLAEALLLARLAADAGG